MKKIFMEAAAAAGATEGGKAGAEEAMRAVARIALETAAKVRMIKKHVQSRRRGRPHSRVVARGSGNPNVTGSNPVGAKDLLLVH